jgi:hypothetical protein
MGNNRKGGDRDGYFGVQRTPRRPAPPIPTLGELAKSIDWSWVWCASGNVAVRYAPFNKRWGADASSDLMRQRLRCSKCGHLGVTLRHPSWIDIKSGFAKFPG